MSLNAVFRLQESGGAGALKPRNPSKRSETCLISDDLFGDGLLQKFSAVGRIRELRETCYLLLLRERTS